MASHPDIILYTYNLSVFGRRIDWYLTLRNIKYLRCNQPLVLPRPDFEKLGIAYCRIPILSIGRDFYCDTRIIIDKLEQLFPDTALNSQKSLRQGINRILESWTLDSGVNMQVAMLIPTDRGLMLDPVFLKDRSEMTGMPITRELLQMLRPMALSQMRVHFDTLEHGLFADGRDFILNTPKPTLADINCVWPFDWALQDLMDMFKCLESEYIGENLFPKVFAYVGRFRKAMAEQEERNGWKPSEISSEEVLKLVAGSEYFEKEGGVDEADPLQQKKGQMVEVNPLDNSSNHIDRGKLVALSLREVVIESPVKVGEGSLRLHFPRLNFKVAPTG